ncbi:MAG TPA: tRNA (guanine(46)-N(7))-methyltransferase TrmB [Alphaproteobacteria bacterium]|jgi:tRNA (guanine-N7-)-methyltransferase
MSESAPTQRLRHYGRRLGRKLRPGRAALLETLLPKIQIPLEPGKPLDPWSLFARRPARLWLEIGFGAGEHAAWQAERHPDTGILAAEIFVNGVASLLRHMAERGLANIRVHPEDARPLLAALPEACLDRVFLLHPDPWPKARHAERRFVNAANLDALARAMADGAELRIASDHPVYKVWTLEQMGKRRDFEWLARRASDWRVRPEDWPETRYEHKAKGEGRTSLYLRYRRRPRD